MKFLPRVTVHQTALDRTSPRMPATRSKSRAMPLAGYFDLLPDSTRRSGNVRNRRCQESSPVTAVTHRADRRDLAGRIMHLSTIDHQKAASMYVLDLKIPPLVLMLLLGALMWLVTRTAPAFSFCSFPRSSI